MSSEEREDSGDELHQLHQEKDAQVLEREPLETELMDEDRSETGSDLDGVEDQ